MTTKIFRINKISRTTPLQDVPINFPKLQNLHLELLEVKDKLKAGLPLIPLSKPILKQMPKPGENPKSSVESKLTDTRKKEPKSETPAEKAMKESIKKSEKDGEKDKNKENNNDKPKDSEKKKVTEDEDIINELGTEDSDVIDPDMIGDSDETVAGSTGATDENENQEPQQNQEEYDIYAGLTPEERMIKEKEEYLWRFRILKKKYGRHLGVQIPEWNEFSDLSMMKTSYDRTIRELYLDDTVETYRTYLVGSWIVMEYMCTEYLSIDLGGFAVQQINSMYKYDSLLIELGEKSCERWTTNLPVELRLIGMILIQAAIFYLGKVITERVGKDAGELFRGVTGQPPAPPKNNTNNNVNQNNQNNQNGRNNQNNQNNQNGHDRDNEDAAEKPTGKKMRGPKISADDIRAKTQNK